MKREQLPLYAIALAVLIVGLAFVGVPLGTLLVLPLILACPLMMFFMMRGMGGMDHGAGGHDHEHRDPSPRQEDLRDHHDTSGR